ncbi:MAG TPA: GNAT family N-acetyltransferase, partial [Candidatus Limnocylindrales bacterium]|nr:GNAT family N-acetyltransferase [Candidatus Limnocylindrales bacterium]
MTTLAPTEPACPGPTDADRHTPNRSSQSPEHGDLRVVRTSFDDVSRATWDRLAAANAWATPFSGWAFQRAWWDAYGESAHDQTTVVCRASRDGVPPTDDPIAIVPLMHRHEVEPGDVDQATKIRHGDSSPLTAVAESAKAIFFGASYHADYATILGSPDDLPAVSAALARDLADVVRDPGPGPIPWDVVDLRRLRCGDPSADALVAAFGARQGDEGWRVDLEREDVCPVVTFPDGASFDDYLSTLDKKARHEVRRKIRRAEAAGDVRLVPSTNPLADLDVFIDLHQKRWGPDGLFPPTPGG